jgi:hypothetical protein
MQKVIIFTVLVLLAGCTTNRVSKADLNQVVLADGLNFQLLPPVSFGDSLHLTQIAEISSDKGQHELLFVLQIENNEMTVVGLLPNGTRVFSIFYDGILIKSEGYSQLIEKLEPKYLIADIQISLWPLAVLQTRWLSNQPCFIKQDCNLKDLTKSAESKSRKIIFGGDELVNINYQNTQQGLQIINFFNRRRGYQINLESTE